ncbi:hypothetical protein ACWGIU_34045 [Streptomyces sp. NPDC054840]
MRGALAEVPASLGLFAAQWSRLVLGETGGARRRLFLEAGAHSGRGLTREVYETPAADPFGPVRERMTATGHEVGRRRQMNGSAHPPPRACSAEGYSAPGSW